MTDAPWHGIFPSLPTPFSPDGGVDLDAQREIVRFAIEHGAHGLICFGLAGEVLQLVPEERKRLCDVIVEETAGRVPVLVGVGAESEHVARDLAASAERAGVDGIVIPPPALARLDNGTLATYFARIAECVALPVMIQDAPDLLGVEVGPEVVRQVAAETGNVGYVKLELGGDRIARWVDELEGTATIFGGNGGLYILDCLRAGARGIAPGLELVDLLVAIHDAELRGDAVTAERLFARFLPMMVFEMQDLHHYNACCKYVLSRRGVNLPTGLCPPAPALPEEALPILDAHLAALELDVVPRIRVAQAGKARP
jgi:dihydrodipicolinate synthase/N-acetylneuraminate lyase